jgi:hypothetical protein
VTKAEQVYQRVEELVASGNKKADAFRQVAEELDQPFNSMRGAYYAHTRTLGGTPARPRTGETNGDPIEQALGLLSRAVESIDTEVADAKERADDAKAEYEQLRDTAKERKAAIQAKIDALKA